ncbi:MAG: CBS domain-containing protein [Planctomycetota bacterium]|jgi:CBS domain-containing protein
MAASQKQVESQVRDPNKLRLETLIELSKKAFDTFCDDISGMFGVDMECKQQEVAAETVAGLQKRFEEPIAVNSVKAEGSLDGTFQLMFDQKGLFTLAGVVVMQPEEAILENRECRSLENAGDLGEVLTEVGDTLVGSWDRTFRKGLGGHGCFVQTNTFVENPWDKSEQEAGPASKEEIVFVPYEMTIAPYPAFKCGVIFPKTILADTSVPIPEQAAPVEEKAPDQKTADEKTDPEESNAVVKSDSEESKPQEPTAENTTQENNNVDTDVSENAAEKKTTTTAQADDAESGPVSKTIRKMAQSPAVLPGESSVPQPVENPALNGTCATISVKDIMQKDLLWGTPDDSIQQALTTMQQHDAEYMIIGRDGVLEGIVSKSDLTGAISPYLRPTFAKWRRPLDDATLQIKLKWIMSKPVHTIGLETSLAAVMENMRQSGRSVLPVTDQQNKAQGLITVFDVFKALLRSEPNISAEAKTAQPSASA